MGFLDKLMGRGKKAAGDLTGDSSLQREGAHQEQAAVADEHAAVHEEQAAEARGGSGGAQGRRQHAVARYDGGGASAGAAPVVCRPAPRVPLVG